MLSNKSTGILLFAAAIFSAGMDVTQAISTYFLWNSFPVENDEALKTLISMLSISFALFIFVALILLYDLVKSPIFDLELGVLIRNDHHLRNIEYTILTLKELKSELNMQDTSTIESTVENDLDYRKDLAKITNTIKSSKLFKEVKDKITGEPEPEVDPLSDIQESYIRNVNDYNEYDEYDEYDEYAPIINETHDEFGEIYEPEYEPDYDQAVREENTRKLMNNVKTTPKPEVTEPKITPIKSKPSRDNIKIQMGNADIVLKKGDEIIFRHDGETYSSQVYGINGDDISVRYRGKNITIKPEDVKKVY